MALPRAAAIPHIGYPSMRFIRMSGAAFSEGRSSHLIDGRAVAMTDPAKTVADCFKFRNQIGLEAALEALREILATRKATVDELWTAAGVCRVGRIIRPYLEALA